MHTKASAVAAALLVVALAALTGCAERSTSLLTPMGRTSCSGVASLGRPLKVANYNIKSGLWTSMAEVGDTLEAMDADIIALEEVDNGTKRAGGVDESEELAERLHADRIFAAALARDGGTYGVALLSRVPVVNAERFALPDVGNFEPRAGIDATVCVGDAPVRVIAAHADVFPWAAKAHAEAIAERVKGGKNVLVLGDFNTTPQTGDTRPFIDDGLADVLASFDDVPTFPGNKTRIDYILTNEKVSGATVIKSDASDHYPVMATMDGSDIAG